MHLILQFSINQSTDNICALVNIKTSYFETNGVMYKMFNIYI